MAIHSRTSFLRKEKTKNEEQWGSDRSDRFLIGGCKSLWWKVHTPHEVLKGRIGAASVSYGACQSRA
jgi:hypothetical protein